MTTSPRRRISVFALALTCVLAAGALFAAANLVGTWKGGMDTQMGTVQVTIAVDGANPLSGQVTLGQFGGKIEQGKVDGDRIAFIVNIEHGTLTFDGTVAGDEMTLTVIGTRGDKMALLAKREK